MLAVAATVGFSYDLGQGGNSAYADIRMEDGTAISINFYGTKYLPTGATANDAMGNPQPVMAAQPGVYAIMRWVGPTVFPPDPNPIPDTVTIIPIPADSPVVFA